MIKNKFKKPVKPSKSSKQQKPQKVEVPKFKIDAEPSAAFNWFPGHMLKAMREIKAKLNMVDLVLEIRDARLPIVSGNNFLDKTIIGGKGHLVILNKTNLADPAVTAEWEAWFEKEEQEAMFINCLEKPVLKTVLTKARRMIEAKRRACNEDVQQKTKYRFMIVGLPNTGKSTFINQIANRQATKTADKPGETRVQLWVTVDEDLELLDTPGVMPPQVENEEHRFWLSAINAIPDDIIGVEDPAVYLIRYFLKNKSEAFKERYKLDTFDLTVDEAIVKIAAARGCLKQKGLPDFDRVFKVVLYDFRDGLLGRATLEKPGTLKKNSSDLMHDKK